MSNLVWSRDLTPADDVSDAVATFLFVSADGKASTPLVITITISAPQPEAPPAVNGWPSAITAPDNAKAGSVLASGAVTNGDGTPFTGTVTGTFANGTAVPFTFQP